MNITQLLEQAQSTIGGDEALIDARYLLSDLLKKDFTWLKTWPDFELTSQQYQDYIALIERRKSGEPIAYITGEKEFWSLRLLTNSSTLIPRAETELLVEKALEFLADSDQSRILDLGTGTGAIALSIASEKINSQVTGCDFQQQAIDLAKKNATLNNITNVTFIQSDWFEYFEKKLKKPFKLIVSNPPYIDETDKHLTQGDLLYEPKSALVSKDNGLYDIKIIISQARNYLLSGAALMIEHGYQQGADVREIFAQSNYSKIETFVDLAGNERVTIGLFQC